MSAFERIAQPLIKRGIPVIPLQPRTKVAYLSNWQELATTDLKQVIAWAEENPEGNVACVAKAKPDGVWFFELDRPGLQDEIERETGQKFPETLCVRSSPGRGHLYFRQTPASLAMGNVQGKDEDGKEAWSARVDDRYVVGPQSYHPTSGKQYELIKDADIAEAPGWLIEWCLKHNTTGQAQRDRLNASTDGPPISHGSHDTELFRIACLLRNAGMDYEQIRDNLVTICEKRCTGYGSDYVDMCEKKAKSAVKYPVGKADARTYVGSSQAAPTAQATDASNWRSSFRTINEMESGPIEMVIDGVLQEGTCFFGGNPGHGKTLVALSFAKSICLGEPLFGIADYTVKQARNVIYLIPESGDRAFRKRGEAFRLPKDDRFFARTISSGGSLALSDPVLMEAVRQWKPVVFLDTASRFLQANDENSSAQNRMLVNDVIDLRAAGAIAVVILHHAKKSATEKRETMTLENMLRGTSDFGAMCDQAYGIRMDERLRARGAGPTEIDIENLKDRECSGGLTSIRLAASYKKSGAIVPTSYINEIGNFRLVNYQEAKARTEETLNQLVENNPMISVAELSESTGNTVNAVRDTLKRFGWHVAKGGPAGHSPWHKDEGKSCPFARPEKVIYLDEPAKPDKRAATVN